MRLDLPVKLVVDLLMMLIYTESEKYNQNVDFRVDRAMTPKPMGTNGIKSVHVLHYRYRYYV